MWKARTARFTRQVCRLDEVKVKGKSKPVVVYEMKNLKSTDHA